MAAVKKGLGKGLDSLIPDRASSIKKETQAESTKSVAEGIVNELDIHSVEPNRDQPRKHFDEDPLHELADSIKQHGVLEPLLVRKKKDYYEIIAGERRWRAAKIAGLKKVPVIVKDFTDEEASIVGLLENIQREDLNPIEEATAFKTLLEVYSLKQDEVAERVSKSRVAVTNSMRLLKLNPAVQQMVIDEMISTGHARALLALDDHEQQLALANRIFDEKLSVRETESLVKHYKTPKDSKEKKQKIEIEHMFVYSDMSEKLKEALGTKTAVIPKSEGKGKIEINYYSEQELERIFDILMGSAKGEQA
ncbi:MAG: ParB/RepB/Spo0J family partition protein [Lachnospiraceae bacterium]|jgi:ParB family chromosome partitioning protein|nr:ParB/RepB/Spo0J family partition protein [Lachnospiraceae bacterium]